MRLRVAALLAVLVPVAARAACDLPILPTASPAGSACALGPPGACSAHPEVTCATDCDCPDNAGVCPAPVRSCPDSKERCIRWPFVDRDADGCFDVEDAPLPLPAVWGLCEEARNGTAGTSSRGTCTRTGALTTCCSGTVPACCTFDARPSPSPKFRVVIGQGAGGDAGDFGITTPAELKCVSNWLKDPNVIVQVQAAKPFRNYAWGGWKDHHQQTRLLVVAPSILLGGWADARSTFVTETHYNYDKDIALLATHGCVVGGTVTDGIGPVNEIQMNKGGVGNAIVLAAPGKLALPAGKWSVKPGKGATALLVGCPVCVAGPDLAPGATVYECQPRCTRTAFPFDIQRYCRDAGGGWSALACLADTGCGVLGPGARCAERTCRTNAADDCPADGDACAPTQAPADSCP